MKKRRHARNAGVGCAKKEAVQEPTIPSNYTTYTDEAGLYSISYPSDWQTLLSFIPDVESNVKDVIKAVDSDAPIEKCQSDFCGWIS
jgi:hypothetical protein